ncbi:hypothetical protein [Methanospirillum sp.]|uniref:hypothetical protein n=1 Tax=Methanospirillum sp. TaxID=45200 RepID=UPI0035A09510
MTNSTVLLPRAYSFSLMFFLTCIALALCGCGVGVFAEKVQVQISINIDPENPGEDLPFTVVGVLIDENGNIMGNKKVSLEQLESDDSEGEYKFLAVTTTDIDGAYSFFRPAASPPEYLRVRYNGNSQFDGTVSEIIKGHISKEPKVKTGVIPSVAKSSTKVIAKVSPANPSPGQTVSIDGQLIGENGAPLPEKKVICEASDRAGIRSDFAILGISNTNEKGYFKFTASGGSTTTFIQVRFPGDDEYDESISDLIMVL